MKTLKKTLCLVLAVVMVLGLGVISASAKLEYTDNEKIDYAEAVDVMSGIGILQGDESGFRPKDTITRAEAAKIIAYIMIGNAEQADALKASADPFTDVPASYWAAGYIAYCSATGIVSGRGDGTFDPYGKVTGLEFAKMLLRALGYGAKDEYTGAEWSIYTSRDGLRYGIYDGNNAGASGAYATREECALYAFNAITNVKKVSYSELLGMYVTGSAWNNDDKEANKGATFADDFDLKNTKDSEEDDEFGRIDGYYWFVDKESNRVTNYYVNGSKLKNTYTTAVTGANVYNLLTASVVKNADVFEVYTDSGVATVYNKVEGKWVADDKEAQAEGDEDAEPTEISPDDIKKDNTKDLLGTGNGVATYVYSFKTDEGKEAEKNVIRIVKINTYLAQVSKVTKATATKDPSTTVNLATDTAPEGWDDGKFETDAFDVDDYVLVTVADGKIQSMVPAVVKEAEITRYSSKGSKKITAGSDDYEFAKESNVKSFADWSSSAAMSNAFVNGKTYNLYLDTYGYLIAVDEVAGKSSYVYAAQFGHKYGSVDDLTDSDNLTVSVYYADGTKATLYVKDNKIGDEWKYDPSDETADAIGDFNGTTSGKNFDWSKYEEGCGATGVYKLTTDSKGRATLDNAELAVELDSPVKRLQRGVTTIATNVEADGSTVFFYVNMGEGYGKKNYSVKAYTGITNIDKTTKDDTAEPISALVKSGTAKAVLVNSDVHTESTDVVYLYNNDFTKKSVGGGKYTVTYRGYDVDGNDPSALVDICTKTYDSETDADDDIKATSSKKGNDDYKGELVNKFVKVSDDTIVSVYGEGESVDKTKDKVWYIEGKTVAKTERDGDNKITETSIVNGTSIRTKEDDETNELNTYWANAKGVVYVDLRDPSTVGSFAGLKTELEDTGVVVSFRCDNSREISVIFILGNAEVADEAEGEGGG